jgi:hypothetical protein
MPGDETRVVEPRTAYGWDGWGACLSWWANTELGRRDDLAAALFGLDPVRVGTTGGEVELPGLGLNIVRYNLGACTWTNGGMVESPAIVRRKQIETLREHAPLVRVGVPVPRPAVGERLDLLAPDDGRRFDHPAVRPGAGAEVVADDVQPQAG